MRPQQRHRNYSYRGLGRDDGEAEEWNPTTRQWDRQVRHIFSFLSRRLKLSCLFSLFVDFVLTGPLCRTVVTVRRRGGADTRRRGVGRGSPAEGRGRGRGLGSREGREEAAPGTGATQAIITTITLVTTGLIVLALKE